MGVQGLVEIVPWTFAAQICNLFLQVYLMKRFLFKPVNAIFEKRRAFADTEIREAEQAKLDAQVMKGEYEKNIREAKNKASEILSSAQKTAAFQSEEILKEASQQAAAMKAKAECDISREKRKAINEIKDKISRMAVEIAEKVIEREIREEDHAKLIDKFIANVSEAL